MKWVKTLLWMIIVFFVIFFVIQNQERVTLRFGLSPLFTTPWFEQEVPLFLALLGSVFVGVLIGGLGDMYGRYQMKRTLRQNRKSIEKLEEEVRALRGSVRGPSPSGEKEP
jgi:uncharacterized integral membrane protein